MSSSIIGGCHSDEKEDGDSNLSFGGFVPGDGSCCLQVIGAASWEVGNTIDEKKYSVFKAAQVGCSDINEVLVHSDGNKLI